MEQGIDLYKRSLEISKREAKRMLNRRYGEKGDPNPHDDIDEDLTDDEQFKQQVKELADQAAKLKEAKKKVFDPEDSYFSEDDSELEKD